MAVAFDDAYAPAWKVLESNYGKIT